MAQAPLSEAMLASRASKNMPALWNSQAFHAMATSTTQSNGGAPFTGACPVQPQFGHSKRRLERITRDLRAQDAEAARAAAVQTVLDGRDGEEDQPLDFSKSRMASIMASMPATGIAL